MVTMLLMMLNTNMTHTGSLAGAAMGVVTKPMVASHQDLPDDARLKANLHQLL